MDEGFIDLRQNTDTGIGGDSFWPSFTDIMMVVVMIFMIASTVLMLRNWELVQELRATIEAEQQAEEMARSVTETNITLEEQLARARRQVIQMRRQLAQADELNQSRTRQINRQEQRLLALEADKQQLTASLQQSRRQARMTDERLTQARLDNTQLVDARDTLRARVRKVLDEFSQLEQGNREQAAELADIRQRRAVSEQQLVSLQGEYDDIRVKYDKLVKPARSTSGKHVVTVRYWKQGEYYQVRIRDEDEDAYEAVNKEQLHQRLAKLKKAYPGKLYVKVIIPDDSGLSYSEAWGFTFDILKKYDYYHKNKP